MKVKHIIYDDLRLSVWNAEDNVEEVSPFYFQDVHPSGKAWESREEIEAYFQNWLIENQFELA